LTTVEKFLGDAIYWAIERFLVAVAASIRAVAKLAWSTVHRILR
jgi:hypothetical protein